VHFLGRYKNASGNDLYLDPAGFPWAILIPGTWSWPYERRNMHVAYPQFGDWYRSAGTVSADWYAFPGAGQVYPLP